MTWFKGDQRGAAKPPAGAGSPKAAGRPVPTDTAASFEEKGGQEGAELADEPPSPAKTSVPTTLGRYEVRRLLGSGGFGAVYLGHDGELDRAVAIKVLRAGSGQRADPERSRQEARRVAQLHHAGIVAVHDIGVHEGEVYVVSDYLEGGDLLAWMRENRASWPEATRIAIAVLDALGHAHARRIIHRDIKPANIMLTAERMPVLVDFGLALSEEVAGPREKRFLLGTPQYMSPEQATGVAHRIDGRTDLYSVGVVLYQLLTGLLPFRATELKELLRQVCEDEPQPPRQLVRDIPPDLERACLKALAKQQQDRYTTAGDFALDLQRVMQAGASQVIPASATPPPAVAALLSAPFLPLSDLVSSPVPSAVDLRTPASVRQAREAERRQLTVLVCGCDTFESEPYLELDSEDQATVLRAFVETCETAVDRFGGTIVECGAKGVVACFGFPLAYEDAAGRAARTGLAILEGMKGAGEPPGIRGGVTLAPWVGIHTGAAVVEAKAGSVSQVGAVSLVGEARNVAVRLEDVAGAGQVICTEASHRLFQGQFQCAPLGRQKIKGAAGPVELFRVERVAVAGSLIDAVAPAELSPLVGRDQEVGLLMDRWEQAREGMGQVVLLVGEAGLGKSRLVHAMKQHVLGQGIEGEVDAPVIEWRCSPHFQNTGLHPAIDFYERALAFDRDVTPQARLDRLLNRLEQYDLARPETVPLWASLLSLPIPERYPPLSLAPVRQREETFRAILDWLHTRAARTPILLVVEDLHWADASTLELLGQFLAESLHDPILTLLSFRPEFKTPWPAVAQQTALVLNRLTQRQAGELMRKKAKRALPEAVVLQIYARTGGVPLFVEEFTTMVQEADVPGREGEGAHGQTLGHEIPATLQDLVMARLDRIEGERELALLAATLGREFSYEVLSAVAALDEPTLQRGLAELVRAEILYPKGRPPRCTYIFKHALLEDALYNALVKGRRQQFHRRVAEVLEAQFAHTAETQPELVAHHFTEAGMGEKAVHYWLKAGLRSRDRFANVEAIGQLARGLAIVGGLAESPERDGLELPFLSALAPCHIAVRGYAAPEVGPVLERARALCERTGQAPQLFGTMLGTWEWRLVRGDIRQCVDLAREGMLLADRLADPGILMEALFMPGVTIFYRGEFAAARRYFERALANYDDRERTKFWSTFTGHDAGVTHRCYLALALWHLGYPDQAMKLDRETRELARTIGHPFTTGHALDFTACLYQFARLGGEVQAAAEAEVAIATDQGFELWHALGTLHKGAGLLLQGRHDDALPILEGGFRQFRGTGAELRVPYYLGMLGEAHARAGRVEEARAAFDEALVVVDRNDDRFQEAELHRLRGELSLAASSDQGVEAEACFQRAIDIARRQQSKAWALRATMSLARLWSRQGRSKEARTALAAVYGDYTEGFTTPDLVDARAMLESLANPARTTS